MKKGHCQDRKNTSAPFYLFPQHWDWGGGLTAWRKAVWVYVCVRDRDRAGVCQSVCMCERQRHTDKCVVLCVYGCIHVAHLKATSLWILKSCLETGENNYCDAPGSNRYKSPVQSNFSDIKLYDVSFNFYFHDSSSNPPPLTSISLLFSVCIWSHCRLCEFGVCGNAYQAWRAGWLVTWCT